ncbi:MAG: adventurous gliding motility protein CglE [Myxococcota bacterium]
MKWTSFLLGAVLVCTPMFAWAQDDEGLSEMEKAFGSDEDEDEEDVPPAFRDEPEEDDVPPAFRDEPVPDEVADPGDGEPLPTIGQEDQLAVFELERGVYFSSDLGVFFTFGGATGSSNAQPYVAVHAGFDINDFLGVQASVAGAYVADNPPSDNELVSGGQQVTSYQMFNLGAELVASLRPFNQIAFEPKVGGGVAFITPSLTDPADPNLILSDINPQLTFGADIKYLTLLTGFTAGASFTGTYVIGPDIPGLAVGLHVRYTL